MKRSGLSNQDKRAIEHFAQRLRAEFGQCVTDVRLFGSKARGEASADSDIDVLVLINRSDYATKHGILWLAAEVSLAFNVLINPRVVPLHSWQKMSEAETLFYRSVSAESLPLFPSVSA